MAIGTNVVIVHHVLILPHHHCKRPQDYHSQAQQRTEHDLNAAALPLYLGDLLFVTVGTWYALGKPLVNGHRDFFNAEVDFSPVNHWRHRRSPTRCSYVLLGRLLDKLQVDIIFACRWALVLCFLFGYLRHDQDLLLPLEVGLRFGV